MTLRLRPARLADRPAVFAWMTAPGILDRMMGPPTFTELEPPDFEEFCADWAPHFWTHERPEAGRAFVLERGGAPAGFFAHNDVVVLPDGERACELDMWLASAELTGRGLGPAALALLGERVRADLDVDLVFLQPSARNPRAIRAYEKAGFRRRPGDPAELARLFSTAPDYPDSVFLVRALGD